VKLYPKITPETIDDVKDMLRYINKERPNDVNDANYNKQSFLNGHSQNTGSVTLTAGAASTVVNNYFIRENGVPILVPMTANAALEATSGNLYISSVADTTFTINHTNAIFTDRTFRYAVIGL